MTCRELVEYCEYTPCEKCVYVRECDEFCEAVGYSPWSCTDDDAPFLNQELKIDIKNVRRKQ